MEDFKNVVETKNKFICVQVFDRVERFTRCRGATCSQMSFCVLKRK